jgi:hypothetical protein
MTLDLAGVHQGSRFDPVTVLHTGLAQIHLWGLRRGGTDVRASHAAGPPCSLPLTHTVVMGRGNRGQPQASVLTRYRRFELPTPDSKMARRPCSSLGYHAMKISCLPA